MRANPKSALLAAIGLTSVLPGPALADEPAEVGVSIATFSAGYPATLSIDSGQSMANVGAPADEPARPASISVDRARTLEGLPSLTREDAGVGMTVASYSRRPNVIVGQRAATFSLAMPIDGARLSSRFGMRWHPVRSQYSNHAGIDLAAPRGTPIMATADGRVTHSGMAGGYGVMVELDHGSGLETRYAHMSRSLVRDGETVKAGQVIGYVGSSGLSTGPHLHYETLVDGRAVDPLAS